MDKITASVCMTVFYCLAQSSHSAVVLTNRQHKHRHNNNNNSPQMEALTSQILADIGLTKLPDSTNLNISAEEYGLMYRVYQKSVRQTEALRTLDEAFLRPQTTPPQEYHIKPTDNLRWKRSSLTAFAEDSDVEAVFLSFNKEDLLHKNVTKNSSKSNDVLHLVTMASLSLGVFLKETLQDLEQEVTFTLYQLTEEAAWTPDAAIAMDRRRVRVGDLSQTVELDATASVQSWLLNPEDNYGLRVVCDLCHQVGVYMANEAVDLAVNVHTTDSQSVLVHRRSSHEGVEKKKDVQQQPVDCYALAHLKGKKKPRCCRESMLVDLGQMPGFEFIQQPRSFDAHVCRGRCPPRYNPTNDHSLLQSIMHLRTRHLANKSDRIPRPCCAPAKMHPLDILHVDERNSSKLRVTHWKNVIVGECACS